MPLQLVARIGVLSAMATVAMAFVKFPLPLLPPFLKYDPSEVFALLGGIALGPIPGLLVVLIKNVMHMVFTGKFVVVSHVANFVAGGTLVFVTAALYRHTPARRHLWLCLLLGSVAMAAVMIPANYYVFLPYRGIAGHEALQTALAGVTPFNFFKALVSSALGLMLYARLGAVLERAAVGGRAVQVNE